MIEIVIIKVEIQTKTKTFFFLSEIRKKSKVFVKINASQAPREYVKSKLDAIRTKSSTKTNLVKIFLAFIIILPIIKKSMFKNVAKPL